MLDASEHTDDVTNVATKHYLVKWRSLPYEDCTWEVETDVDPLKIAEFEVSYKCSKKRNLTAYVY